MPIWLYHRFGLSLREVEEMLLERGIVVSYETSPVGQEARLRLCPQDSKEVAIEGRHLAP